MKLPPTFIFGVLELYGRQHSVARQKYDGPYRDGLLETGSWYLNVAISLKFRMVFVLQVYVYNEQVIQGGIKPNLAQMMMEVSETIDDQVQSHAVAFYNQLH